MEIKASKLNQQCEMSAGAQLLKSCEDDEACLLDYDAAEATTTNHLAIDRVGDSTIY